MRQKCRIHQYDLNFPWMAERRMTANLHWSDTRFYKLTKWPEFEGDEAWFWAEKDHRGRVTIREPCEPPEGWAPLLADPYYAAVRRWNDWVNCGDPDKGPEPPPPPGGWRNGGV